MTEGVTPRQFQEAAGGAMHRLALVIGIVGGLSWIGLGSFPPECAPVTETSEVYCNRLWTPALTAMLIGAAGLFWSLHSVFSGATRWGLLALVIGFALMAVGNGGEYWLAYDLPHQGGPGAVVRSLLWMTALAGWLTALIAGVIVGARVRAEAIGSGRRPGWLSLLLVLPLPLTFILAAAGSGLFLIPIGLLGIFVGVYGLAGTDRRADAHDLAGDQSGT